MLHKILMTFYRTEMLFFTKFCFSANFNKMVKDALLISNGVGHFFFYLPVYIVGKGFCQ